MKKLFHTLIASLLFLAVENLDAQISFGINSIYSYLKGKDASTLASSWYTQDFNASGWATAQAPFRYGDGSGGTELTDMQNNYSTLYLRADFSVANAENIEELNVSLDYDDGYILWINGIKASSFNAPEDPAFDSFSTDLRESGTFDFLTLNASDFNLKNGSNLIAVQVFNTTLESSDFYFAMGLAASTVMPRIDLKPVFSHPAGFYSTPFTLTISSPAAGYKVYYTLDGSNPDQSATRIEADNQVNINIDPLSSINRPVTPAVIVRASLAKSGLKPSFSVGRTFIFAEEVSEQDYPGGEWPVENINGQIIDLHVESGVVSDPRYSSKMIQSLKAIPTISLITNINNLFESSAGIYVNAERHGEEWERECSAELINPDGSKGFQVNAGLRIRGGWSRHDQYPKHAFRLFFNQEYGDPKLDFPLFEEEGASKFDKIDLRCEQNYSWANAWDGMHNTHVRDVFSRDTQGDMMQPYSRSRQYHLYLNGMYWGIYQTQERTEADFASTYFGGKDSDYDVVKVNTEDFNYRIEATDGTLDVWEQIWNLLNEGFETNSKYFILEGKDSRGQKIPGEPVLVDIDNLIDYMLIIFYTGNFDSPTSSFGSNKGCNNFFAIYNKTLQTEGFKFFAHDAEHSLFSEPYSPGLGLYEDRVNLARRPGSTMVVYGFDTFHPQWLHEKLTENTEYRLRFADRAFKYLKPGNVLSPEACLQRFNDRASELDYAIIAESARWGGSKGTFPPRTKDDTWIPELNKIRTEFFPYRSGILADQLSEAGLYPAVLPANFVLNGITTFSDTYLSEGITQLSFINTNSSGTVYYTLDNSDPRNVGGTISSKAITWNSGSSISISHSSSVKTRVYQDGNWSAMNQLNILSKDEDYSNLKVTELMYHPADLISGNDTVQGTSLEFIEFKNTGSYSINISGMILDSAVYCEFPKNTLLEPGKFFVVASKPGSFKNFYGFPPSANFSGNLSNGGEYVLLTDPEGIEVFSFTYDDQDPWPVEPDGEGYSLVSSLINPAGNPDNYLYWKTGSILRGTPFADDDLGDTIEEPDAIVTVDVYPNPSSDRIYLSLNGQNTHDRINVKIFNLGGTLLLEKDIDSSEPIDLNESGIRPGAYFIRIERNEFRSVLKLIVTR